MKGIPNQRLVKCRPGGWSRRIAGVITLGLAGTVAAVGAQGTQAPGFFTARQAAQGRSIYALRCAACHGERLQGGTATALAGPAFARAWERSG